MLEDDFSFLKFFKISFCFWEVHEDEKILGFCQGQEEDEKIIMDFYYGCT